MEVENKDFLKISVIVLGLISAIILLMLSGCKTKYITQEVPVPYEVTHTEYVNHETIKHDTLMVRDSVYHYVNGDSVIIEKWNTLIKTKIEWVHDTIRQTDSIPFPVEIKKPYPVPVEKELTRWQKIKMSTGGYLFGLLGIAIVGGICYIFRRRIPIIKNLVK